MNKKYLVVFSVVFLFLTVVTFVLMSNRNTTPGELDDFANCVAESGTRLFSAWWCPHCQSQKEMFSSSFEILEQRGVHIECSPGGARAFTAPECMEAQIEGTPTWIFGDGTRQGGSLPLSTIAARTNCTI